MSNLLQTVHHPDADHLSAFAEHALPAHEQQQTLAHLATCPDCRAIVFLAQQALPVEATQPLAIPARRPWLSTWNLSWAATAAFACALLVTIGLHNLTSRESAPAPVTTVAQSAPPPAAPAPTALATSPAAKPASSPVAAVDKLQSLARVPQPTASAPQPIAASQRNGFVAGTIAAPAASSALHGSLFVRPTIPGDGAIRGTVADPTGAAVANALVTATNTETGVQTARTTSSDGGYDFRQLPPGRYNVQTVARGFERLLQENVEVAPMQIAGLNMKLNVGSASETVTVTTAPAALNTQDASLGGTIENELYSQLPLSMGGNPRDPAAFAYLTPGAAAAPKAKAGAATNPAMYGGSGQANLNENYIDGVPVANISAQGKPTPDRGGVSVDAVDQLSASASTATQAGVPAGQARQQQTVTLAQTQALTHNGPLQSQQQYQLAAPPPAPPPPALPPPPAAAPAAGGGAGGAGARPATAVALGKASVAPAGSVTVSGANTVAVSQTQPTNLHAVASLLALPSHLLAVSSVSRAAQTLAIDTVGTLYLSKDSGKTWQPVPTQWTGHAVKLGLAPSPSAATGQKAAVQAKAISASLSAFELTTASGAVWTSPDGQHWKLK